jgi:hypothetical protein
MTQKANKPSDSQRECDKAKRVQIARCATLGSFFYKQNQESKPSYWLSS